MYFQKLPLPFWLVYYYQSCIENLFGLMVLHLLPIMVFTCYEAYISFLWFHNPIGIHIFQSQEKVFPEGSFREIKLGSLPLCTTLWKLEFNRGHSRDKMASIILWNEKTLNSKCRQNLWLKDIVAVEFLIYFRTLYFLDIHSGTITSCIYYFPRR